MFVPIKLEQYVLMFLKSNPDDSADAVRERLAAALADHRAGVRCHCGNPLWVIGSAEAGNACFTCITGDVEPDKDYELDEALASSAV